MHCRGQSPNASKKILDLPIPPPGRLVDGCRVWDRFRLDEAFDALPDENDYSSSGWELEQSVADAGCFTKLGGVRDLIVAVVLLVIDTMRPAV